MKPLSLILYNALFCSTLHAGVNHEDKALEAGTAVKMVRTLRPTIEDCKDPYYISCQIDFPPVKGFQLGVSKLEFHRSYEIFGVERRLQIVATPRRFTIHFRDPHRLGPDKQRKAFLKVFEDIANGKIILALEYIVFVGAD